MKRILTLAVAAATLAVAAERAHAQTAYSALECYNVKDKRSSSASMADLTLTPRAKALAEASQCHLAGDHPKAKQLCTPVALTPDGNPQGVDLSKSYLCYVVTCPKGVNVSVKARDRVGRGKLEVAGVATKRRICLPTTRVQPAP